LQCVAVCCSVLQCVAVCCSVLQCVAVWCSVAVYRYNHYDLQNENEKWYDTSRSCKFAGGQYSPRFYSRCSILTYRRRCIILTYRHDLILHFHFSFLFRNFISHFHCKRWYNHYDLQGKYEMIWYLRVLQVCGGHRSRRRWDLKKIGSQDLSVFLIDLLSDGDSVYSRENLFEILRTPVKTCLMYVRRSCENLLEILAVVIWQSWMAVAIILSVISSVWGHSSVSLLQEAYHCNI